MKTVGVLLALALLGPAQASQRGRSTTTVPIPAPRANSGSAPNNTFFVTWSDPREKAFQVGVPQGWQVSGGMIRTYTVESHTVHYRGA